MIITDYFKFAMYYRILHLYIYIQYDVRYISKKKL